MRKFDCNIFENCGEAVRVDINDYFGKLAKKRPD